MLKRTLEIMHHYNSTGSNRTLVTRATLLSSVSSGSKRLIAFTRGYTPAVLVLTSIVLHGGAAGSLPRPVGKQRPPVAVKMRRGIHSLCLESIEHSGFSLLLPIDER